MLSKQTASFARRAVNLKRAQMIEGVSQMQKMTSNQRTVLANLCLQWAQKRSFQTPYKPGTPVTVLDTMGSVYDDPKFTLDVKPVEFRDGQINSYNQFGAVAVGIPCFIACFYAVCAIIWYTMFDTEVQFFRAQLHPYLEIKTGRELARTRNPMFLWTYKFAPNTQYNVRNLFYLEIEDAIRRRKEMDLQRKAAKQ